MRLLLLQNMPLKLVSLALAALLWFVIAGEKSSEVGLSVPVELKNFPKDLERTGDAVNAVEVRLRASPSIIQSLGPQGVSAHVDLSGVGEGEHIVNLTADSIRIPFGVKVVRINPSALTLTLERTVQKVVPVHPRLLGRPAPGHEVVEGDEQPARGPGGGAQEPGPGGGGRFYRAGLRGEGDGDRGGRREPRGGRPAAADPGEPAGAGDGADRAGPFPPAHGPPGRKKP